MAEKHPRITTKITICHLIVTKFPKNHLIHWTTKMTTSPRRVVADHKLFFNIRNIFLNSEAAAAGPVSVLSGQAPVKFVR